MFRTPIGTVPRGGAPDRAEAIAAYRDLAAGYDATCDRIEVPRRRAIELLGLEPGERVLDVACGSGKSLPLLAAKVGATGCAVGIDQSPEMIALAEGLIAPLGNAQVVLAPMEEADPPGPFDALLFCYTHDVLRNRRALERIFAAARPGARVAALGVKLFPWWLAPLNVWVRRRAWGYLSTVEGLDRPWQPLTAFVPDIRVVHTYFAGSGYIATGTVAR